MYKSRKNNYKRFKNRDSYYPSHKKSFRGFNSGEKRLDPSVFIRKVDDIKAGIPNMTNMTEGIKFVSFNIVDKLKRNILQHGYISPTEIQAKAIPEIMAGRDIIAMANTGSGKTAAFLISLINKAFLDRSQRVLIVVPTRELALQIADEFVLFASGTNLETVALVGGTDVKRQIYALRHNPHFVIGTPGRLKDLINRKILNLQLFQNVVLDEVDRMVDIGFIHDIEYLISFLPRVRQSLFFSATIDNKTEKILHKFVKNPVSISVKKQETLNTIDQDIVKISKNMSKIDVLHDLLAQSGFDKVIIFGKTKWGIQKLTNNLTTRGFRVAAIHGNKSQNQRQRALQQFKRDEINILLATDVASRGLDIENVTHVINYDAPSSYEDYIHRIGRTGRAGKRGKALTFVE